MKTATSVKLAPQTQTKTSQKWDKLNLSAPKDQSNIINPSRNITADDEFYLRDCTIAAAVISWDLGIYDSAAMVKPSDITNIAITSDTVWYQVNGYRAFPLNIEVFHSHRLQIDQHERTWVTELTKTQNAPKADIVKVKPQFARVVTSDLQQPEALQQVEWKVTYDSKWDWYYVWVGERLAGRASNHEEAERLAQQYIATDELIRRQNAAVLLAYAG